MEHLESSGTKIIMNGHVLRGENNVYVQDL